MRHLSTSTYPTSCLVLKIYPNSVRIFALVVMSCFIFVSSLCAQIGHGGTPISFTKDLQRDVYTITMPPVDVEALIAEDEANAASGAPSPYRFGYGFDVEYSLYNTGTWEILPDGSKVWRLRIVSPGAYSINLIFSEYLLPTGARFSIYSEDRKMVKGAFTAENNKDHGKFATGLVIPQQNRKR